MRGTIRASPGGRLGCSEWIPMRTSVLWFCLLAHWPEGAGGAGGGVGGASHHGPAGLGLKALRLDPIVRDPGTVLPGKPTPTEEGSKQVEAPPPFRTILLTVPPPPLPQTPPGPRRHFSNSVQASEPCHKALASVKADPSSKVGADTVGRLLQSFW